MASSTNWFVVSATLLKNNNIFIEDLAITTQLVVMCCIKKDF